MIALIKRDLMLSVRAGGGFGLALVFFLIVIALVPFGIGADPAVLARIAPGMIWVSVLLASILTLDRMYSSDFEDGSLAALATSSMPLETVFLAKSIVHWLTTCLPLTVAAMALGFLLYLPEEARLPLLLGLLVGSPALSLIGGFGASLTFGLKRGGLLLSVLTLPMCVPTLMMANLAASRTAADLDASFAYLLLAAISLGSFALLPFAGAAAIRANLR